VIDTATPGATTVGWIGTGVMGASMCRNLLAAHFDLRVHSRTKSKAAPLMEMGAGWADAPDDLGACDVVFTMLGYPAEVEAVYTGDGTNAGLVSAAKPGAILVDMSTSSPDLALRIARMAEAAGLHMLDAPVTGGDVGARDGTLSIMVGGSAEAFEAVLPCLNVLGNTIVHHGRHGSGQHAKLVNQTLIAGTMTAVSEALLYAQQAGLDIAKVLSSVSAGSGGSWSLTNLAPRMVRGDFAPGFYVDHFVKDMAIALEQVSRLRLALPGLALAHQLYVALQAQGRGSDGTQSLVHALAALSNIDWLATPDP